MAAVVTPVKQQHSQLFSQRRSGSRRRSAAKEQLLQRTPSNSNNNSANANAMNSVHNVLAPALSLPPSKKRSRETSGAGSGNNNKQLQTYDGVDALDEDSDLMRNGRALFAATTTALAAPLDIPNKRRRTTANADTVAQPPSLLATPKQPNTLLNAVGTTKQASSRKQASTGKSSKARDGEASRATAAEKRAQQEDVVTEWYNKYSRAIKGFTFYFDCFEDSKRKEFERALRTLGAKTEPFFCKTVTHVVTTRQIPDKFAETSEKRDAGSKASNNIFRAPGGKENAAQVGAKRQASESPIKRSMLEEVSANKRPRTRLGAAVANNSLLALKTPPKSRSYVDYPDSQDILAKAKQFKMSLWDVSKLERVLNRLLGMHSPEKDNEPLRKSNKTYHFNFQATAAETKPSLPYLLRAEQITGSTYERDPTATRSDYVYFNRSNGYLLVEDISGEYTPAHAKEYDQRISAAYEDNETEWPTLFGGQDGRGAFFRASRSHVPPLPAFPNLPKVETEPVFVAAKGIDDGPLLRRAVSMNGLRAGQPPRTRAQHSAANLEAYQIASGNSQIITSNIASGTSTTTTRSGQVIGAGGGNSLAKGIIIDKRLARLGSKAKKHVVTLGRLNADDPRGLLKRSLTANQKPMSSVKAVREHVPKPGYCENCRIRYEDFKEHTLSRKHRKFATNPANWEELDKLLNDIKRPINKELLQLYDAAGCECPSDVERSDDEEDDEWDDNDGLANDAEPAVAVDEEDEYTGEETQDSGYAVQLTPEASAEAALVLEKRAHAQRKVPFNAHQLQRIHARNEEAPHDEDDLEEDEDEEESLGGIDTDEEEDALRRSSESGSMMDDGDEEEEEEEDIQGQVDLDALAVQLDPAEIVDLTGDDEAFSI